MATESNEVTKPDQDVIAPQNDQNPNDASPNGINGVNGHVHDESAEHSHEHNHDDPNAGALFQISVKLPHRPYKMNVMVSNQEQVQDVRQSIIETPDTFQYTCFHLEHNGQRINDFVELSEVKDLTPNSEISLIEDPYSEKEARTHVVRIRELIGAAGDRSEQQLGICSGLSLHDDCFGGSQPKAQSEENPLLGFDISTPATLDTILPGHTQELPKTIKSLSVSVWNPPPHHLRQRGHLLYLQLTTNEGDQHQITASTTGFFVSKSSSNKFDPFPRPAPKNHASHSLLPLISILSPSFNDVFVEFQKINGQKDLLTTFPFQNAIPASPWLVPSSLTQNPQQHPDPARSQETFLVSGSDGAENLRDWNEEFQTTKELPRDTLQDRVFRERLTSKLFADYNDAAAKGAVLVARGEVAPLNPTEGNDAQIFIYNNIFYSYGCDGVQTFASEGGDEAARVAVGKDVAGVKAVNQLDIPGLFTPGTVIVDYLGKRIVAQSIVPGIFKQREPGEHQIDYGGVEGRDIVTENPAFIEVFDKLSKAMRVKKHAVWDKEGKRHDLEGSVETKGLLGTDGRKYVLDLYRITPLDVAWAEEVGSPEESANSYPHRMSVLRLELVEGYWRTKMQEYVKSELDKRKTQKPGSLENGEAKGPVNGQKEKNDAGGDAATEAEEAKADAEEGPSDQDRVDISNFNLALNPDVCTGQLPQTDAEKADYAKDEEEVRAVCDYLRSKIIPGLLTDLYEGDVGFPMDGASLCQLLHKRGINIRYLGHLAKLASEKGRRLEAFVTVARQEMVSRAFKHISVKHLRHLPTVFAPSCISHLLNCSVVKDLTAKITPEIDAELKEFYPDGDFSYEHVTPKSLQEDVRKQIAMRYRYDLTQNLMAEIKPLQLLRELCLRLGFQIKARDYDFGSNETISVTSQAHSNGVEPAATNGTAVEEGKKKKKKAVDHSQTNGTTPKSATTLTPEDVLNIVPVVKDAAPKSALAEEALEAGKISLAQGQKQLGQELVLESLSLHEQIYGILHPEVAKMYHSLSTIYYQTDEKEAAVELARKAVIVTERTLGVDSHDTILAYLNLSLFEHHVGNTHQALKYVRHALNVWKIVYGTNHPDSITTINNAAVMLQSMKQYAESRKWFEACHSICEDLFGQQTINAATILFQLAQALALDGDAKAAVSKMRDAYNIFLSELGPTDRNTKEAENWLEQLTQNAVAIAKQAKDIQQRRLRGIRYLPRMGTTRLQPQSVDVATPNLNSTGQNTGTTTGGHARSPTGSVALDSRSIDELLKFIEGADAGKGSGKSQKKKSMNPKARSARAGAGVGVGVGKKVDGANDATA